MSECSNRNIGRVSRSARGALLYLASLVVVTAAGAGCAKAKAASLPQGPALAVPSPPPRVLIPIEEEEPRAEAPAPSQAPPEPPAPAAPAPRANTRVRADSETRTEPTAPAPVAPAAAATEKPTLQIAPSPGESAASEKQVATHLARYQRAVNLVDEARLSAPQRANLSEARRLERVARDNLTQRNYQAASLAADKAAQLAESLLK